MPSDVTIHCPACGKKNALPVDGVERHTLCVRCEVDLQPLLRIQLATVRLQGQLLRQLSTRQSQQAHTTFEQLQTLSSTAAQVAVPLRKLIS